MELNNLFKLKTIKIAVVTFLVGIVLYGVLSFYSGYDNLSNALSIFPIKTFLPLILVLVFFGLFLRGLRWHYYLRQTEITEVPFLESMHIFLASFALTVTPGKIGELVKSAFLKNKYNVPVSKTAGILLMERLMDLIGVLILASCAFFFSGKAVWIFIVTSLVVIILVALICFEKLYKPLLLRLAKLNYFGVIFQKILEILITSRSLFTFKIITISILFSVIAWGAEAFAFWLVLSGFGLNITFFGAVFIYAISTIAGAISMLPGGLGSTEVTMLGLLALQGVIVANAVPAVLLIRLSTLWFVPAVGVIFMIALLAKTSKHNV